MELMIYFISVREQDGNLKWGHGQAIEKPDPTVLQAEVTNDATNSDDLISQIDEWLQERVEEGDTIEYGGNQYDAIDDLISKIRQDYE